MFPFLWKGTHCLVSHCLPTPDFIFGPVFIVVLSRRVCQTNYFFIARRQQGATDSVPQPLCIICLAFLTRSLLVPSFCLSHLMLSSGISLCYFSTSSLPSSSFSLLALISTFTSNSQFILHSSGVIFKILNLHIEFHLLLE